MLIKFCEVCNKEFYPRPAHVRIGWGRFCSQSCRTKVIKNAKGSIRSKEYLEQMSERMKGKFSNEKHWAWKGKDASYVAIHQWMTRNYGQPQKCDFCLTTKAKRFHWANKSKEYRRIRTDWFRLCQSCHFKYDNVGEKSWETRKGEIGLY